MKCIWILLLTIFCIGNVAFAQGGEEPIISYNVHVIPKATADQCTSTWNGTMYPDAEETLSGAGEQETQTGPVIRSCTGCSIDSKTSDCVCSTCYDHYN